MNKKMLKRILFATVLTMLIAAIAVCSVSCKKDEQPKTPDVTADDSVTTVGEGATAFDFEVTDADGKVTKFNVKTDKATVGEALLEYELIAGDDEDYGLYVKTVNGVTYDYNTDGKYWAFYVNGEYAMSGVDSTNIEAGATYAFKAE